MHKYRNYTDEDIINNAKNVYSIAGLLKALDLRIAGGNYANMRKNLQRLNVDTSHWTGQGWNKDKQLKDWSKYTRVSHLRKHLIKDRGNKCECCNNTTWMGHPIPLEVHHIDGDRCNNDITNFKLLCPNCHAQTDSYRRRNINKNRQSDGIVYMEVLKTSEQ